MDWLELTAADARAQMSNAEYDAIIDATRDSGASTVITTCISRVVNRVRGYVESRPENTLGPDGYVPAVLYDAALALLLENLATTLPAGLLILDEARQKRIEGARAELRMVAEGKLKISYGSGQSAGTDAPSADTGDYGGDDPVSWSGVR